MEQRSAIDLETNGNALQSTLDELAYLLINPSRLTILNDSEIGSGGYGEVCLATLDGSLKVAVKQLQIIQARGTRARVAMRLARELKIWAKAQHPNVLRLIGYYLSENYRCAQLVSPYMEHGNITEYLERTQAGTETRLGFVRGITLGVTYLHSCNPPICHGDLKPANVLINETPDAVLCDFGLATFVENSGDSSGLTTSRSIKGSLRYMSPELFDNVEAKHTLESDIWAWACTIFEIIANTIPYANFRSDSRVMVAVVQGTSPGSMELLSSLIPKVDMPLRSVLGALQALFPECWSSYPEKRPSAFTVVKHLKYRDLGAPAAPSSPSPPPAPAIGEKPDAEKYRATYPFSGLAEGGLALEKDDVVELIEKVANGWCVVKKGSEEGLVPCNHLEFIPASTKTRLMATAPEWLTTGQVSPQYLTTVYSTLMQREAARRRLSQASIPPQHQQLKPMRNSLKKFFKLESGSHTTKELSGAEECYAIRVASTATNRDRNRYSDIEPYDRNRVLVGSLDESNGRYLNASWVREVEGRAWWIATQAPLFKTTHAFLSLLTSLQPEPLRPTTIVQLTQIFENGVRKADQYIPETPSSGPRYFYPESERPDTLPIEVTLKSQEFVSAADCVVSTVVLKLLTKPTPEVVEIKHIDYQGWPEQSIPTNADELFRLVRVVQDTNASMTPNSSPRPILCHCSAGVGRTGTFIALTSLLRSYGFLQAVPESTVESFPLAHLFPLANGSPLGSIPSSISDDPVAREVDGLREQRTTMVQRSEQLGIIYQVLLNSVAGSRYVSLKGRYSDVSFKNFVYWFASFSVLRRFTDETRY